MNACFLIASSSCRSPLIPYSPVDGRVAMLYLKPDALFEGAGDLVTQIKRFACALSS